MALVLNTLPNKAISIGSHGYTGHLHDRLQQGLPDNPTYVIFDYGTVYGPDIVFFTMEAIELAKDLNKEHVILIYAQESLHRKFWEINTALLSKAGYTKALLIDAGNDISIQSYLNVVPGMVVRFLTSSAFFDSYSGKPGFKEAVPFNNVRSKHYISLARYSRKERIQLTCKLLDNELLKNSGRYSCGWADHENYSNFWGEDAIVWNVIPSHLKSHFPITLGDTSSRAFDLLPHIADNVFNVVLEGQVGHNPATYIENTASLDQLGIWRHLIINSDRMMATEKTTKAFAMNQIPLILASPGLVEKLRTMNFDLFDDVIDHSYDKECDIVKRIDLIIEQLIKVCEKDITYWGDFLNENKDRFYHNQQQLIHSSDYLHSTNKQFIKEFFV
tara:strand:+ start:1325 stop:2488 length:1164 start_codon:yes stop_codon:yes gene_type:complete